MYATEFYQNNCFQYREGAVLMSSLNEAPVMRYTYYILGLKTYFTHSCQNLLINQVFMYKSKP